MKCSLCGAPDVNKSSCPLNPKARNPKPDKHNKKTVAVAKPKPAKKPVAVTVAKPKPVKKPAAATKPRPVKKPVAKPAVKPKSEPDFSETAIRAQAKKLFPKDPKKQEEYIADTIRISMPLVPSHDAVHKAHVEQVRKRDALRASVRKHCELCHKAIRARNLIKPDQWHKVSAVCHECFSGIEKLYNSGLPDAKKGYAEAGKGSVVAEDIVARGAQNGYYNATMYRGSQRWNEYASKRFGQTLPKIPK